MKIPIAAKVPPDTTSADWGLPYADRFVVDMATGDGHGRLLTYRLAEGKGDGRGQDAFRCRSPP